MKEKLIIGGSYMASTLIICTALFTTPDMQHELNSTYNESISIQIKTLISYVVTTLMFGLPWFLIYNRPKNEIARKSFFSILSVMFAAFFYYPIKHGMDFAIGLNIIFYIISIIILFPVSKLIK